MTIVLICSVCECGMTCVGDHEPEAPCFWRCERCGAENVRRVDFDSIAFVAGMRDLGARIRGYGLNASAAPWLKPNGVARFGSFWLDTLPSDVQVLNAPEAGPGAFGMNVCVFPALTMPHSSANLELVSAYRMLAPLAGNALQCVVSAGVIQNQQLREARQEIEQLQTEVSALRAELHRRDHCHVCSANLEPPDDFACRCEEHGGRQRDDYEPEQLCECGYCTNHYERAQPAPAEGELT